MDLGIDFGTILTRTWVGLGSQDGLMLTPKSDKNRPRPIPGRRLGAIMRPDQLQASILIRLLELESAQTPPGFDFGRFLIDFWSIFDRFLIDFRRIWDQERRKTGKERRKKKKEERRTKKKEEGRKKRKKKKDTRTYLPKSTKIKKESMPRSLPMLAFSLIHHDGKPIASNIGSSVATMLLITIQFVSP